MNADGTLSQAELRKHFKVLDASKRYVQFTADGEDRLLQVGDLVRIVAYNNVGWFDGLWESPQSNAEEHTEEITKLFTDQGVVALLHRVQGVEVSDKNGDRREAYAYDLEVVGFTEEPHDLWVEGSIFTAGTTRGLLALGAALAGGALFIGALMVAKVEVLGAGEGSRMVSNGIFWISLAAIAVSIAVVFKTAKAASP